MGRIAQKGLAYFSIDTAWETSVRLLKAKYGALEAVGFLTEIWSVIYRENYFIEWNDESELLFADEIKRPVEWVREVIEYCLQKGIFDKAVYEAKSVLTSHGIQKRYFKIARDSLKRDYIDYLPGITYPEFMPENKVGPYPDKVGLYGDKAGGNPGNPGLYADKRSGAERSGAERIELNGKQAEQQAGIPDPEEPDAPDAPPARSPVSLDFLKKKIQGSKYPLSLVDAELERIANRFAEIDLTAQDLDPLMDYLIDRVDRGAKKNPKGLLMKALLEYDWHLDFQSERPKPKKPRKASAPAFPDPGPCSCGGMLIVGGEKNDMAFCTKCKAQYEYDPELRDPEIGETGWIKLNIPDESSG